MSLRRAVCLLHLGIRVQNCLVNWNLALPFAQNRLLLWSFGVVLLDNRSQVNGNLLVRGNSSQVSVVLGWEVGHSL